MAYCDTDNLHTVFLREAELALRGLKRYRVGQIHLSSGRIVACDPFVYPESAPFTRMVPQRGDFPVEVIESSSPSHYALAVLWLVPPAQIDAGTLSWEMARLPGNQGEVLGEDEFFGYWVDAGAGALMDADTFAAIEQAIVRYRQTHPDQACEEGDCSPFTDFLLDAFYPQDENGETDYTCRLVYHPLGADHPANLAVFTSGWGDGSYPSYWALDGAGQAVALVTDFLMLTHGMEDA